MPLPLQGQRAQQQTRSHGWVTSSNNIIIASRSRSRSHTRSRSNSGSREGSLRRTVVLVDLLPRRLLLSCRPNLVNLLLLSHWFQNAEHPRLKLYICISFIYYIQQTHTQTRGGREREAGRARATERSRQNTSSGRFNPTVASA